MSSRAWTRCWPWAAASGSCSYLGFQEVAGLRARIGDSMYSLLGNANLQILMRLAGRQRDPEIRRADRRRHQRHPGQQLLPGQRVSACSAKTPNADVRQTSRGSTGPIFAGLIEGEAIVLFGKERVYAKLFHAEIDANGPMRMNRPLMLRPPAPGEVRKAADRVDTIKRHILSGRARAAVQTGPSPTLDAVLTGFTSRLTEAKADAGSCADAAIRELHLVRAEEEPARTRAAAAQHGRSAAATVETEFSPILEGASKPPIQTDFSATVARARPLPAAQESAVMAIEVSNGSSAADARTAADELAAVQQEAAETGRVPFAPVDAQDLKRHLATLLTELEAIVRPTPRMRAAE